MLLEHGTILGKRYEIQKKIGAGGMAMVYQAKDRKLERFVTVKVLREEFVTDEEFVSRFKIEAQSAASLNHSNIVNVYDVGQDENIYYIVMEYVEGETLKELINRKAPFDNEVIVNVAMQIASGLQHAHKNHIIHRDIKPQNIMVTPDGVVKVTDFGIARAATTKTVAMTGSAIGSVHYFSPEQARGGYVDEKSDIYSLGIVMFEMATSVVPYDGESPVAVALKQISDPLPDIARYNKNISKSLLRMIEKATQKNTIERYVDINEMYVDLKKSISDNSGSFVQTPEPEAFNTAEITNEEVKKIRNEAKNKTAKPQKAVLDLEPEGDATESEPKYGAVDLLDVIQHSGDSDVESMDGDGDDGSEWKIIVAAICVAIVIIMVIVYFGMRFINNRAPSNKTTEQGTVVLTQLIGKQLDIAKAEMAELGIELEVQENPSDTAPEGEITWQQYDEGSILPETIKTIKVQVSAGPFLYLVPNAYLQLQEDVEAFIIERVKDADVKIEYGNHDTVPFGAVYDQMPSPNAQVAAGTTITVYVSEGQENKMVLVPSVEGDRESDAIQELEEKGLVVAPSVNLESEIVPEGRVIKQSLAANTEVAINSQITLYVSTGAAQTPVETPSTETPTTQEPPTTTQPPPEPPTTEPVKTTKSFTVQVYVPTQTLEDADTVRVTLKSTVGGEENFIINDKEIPKSELPYSVNVTASGTLRMQLWLNDELQFDENAVFSE